MLPSKAGEVRKLMGSMAASLIWTTIGLLILMAVFPVLLGMMLGLNTILPFGVSMLVNTPVWIVGVLGLRKIEKYYTDKILEVGSK